MNNMLPEWSRFITEVKLNRGLKESNFDQLYAYLKQHEVHANENRMMMERFIQPTNDPLALVSNASVQQYPTHTSTNNLIESLTNTLALLRTSSNARNKATVEDDRVVVQDVRDRYNVNNQGRPFQRNNARGNLSTNFDDDVDDLALNVDHVFEADQCNAFDSDVDESLPPHSPCSSHEMQSDVQHKFTRVLNFDTDYTSDSNIIPYDQYVEDNQKNMLYTKTVSLYKNDALMSIPVDEMHEQGDQSSQANNSTNEKTSSLLTQIEDLKAQLEGNLKVAARSSVKTKVLAPGSVETVREIVEEARVVKPLDNVLNYACQYTKLSQELVEYVIGTCPKEFPRKKTGVHHRKLKNRPHVQGDSHLQDSVNATPTVKIVLNKGKQIWKPKGKLSDNSLNKTKQIWQPKGKLSDNSLNKTKQVWKATGKKFALGELCPLTRLPVTCGTDHPLVSGLRLFKTRFRGMNGSSLRKKPPTIEDTSITQATFIPQLNPVEGEPSNDTSQHQGMCLLESVNRVLERQKKLRNQIFRALTASADVPSSVTETTDTTSTLQPPPNPLTKTYRSSEIIGRKLKDQNISNASLVEDSEILATQTNQRSE
ncbi:hypothetical protein Tco_1145780 [Tanacetum coccineum]